MSPNRDDPDAGRRPGATAPGGDAERALRVPFVVAWGVAAALVACSLVAFVLVSQLLAREAQRLDDERVRLATVALEAAATRQTNTVNALLQLLADPGVTGEADFAAAAGGTVGGEDVTPTLVIEVLEGTERRVFERRVGHQLQQRTASGRRVPAPIRGHYLVVRQATMTTDDPAAVGLDESNRTALHEALDSPAAQFGVAASVPDRYQGRTGIWLVGPVSGNALRERERFVASFVRGDRLLPATVPGDVSLRIDGRALVESAPIPADSPRRSFELAGRSWSVRVERAETSLATRLLPFLIAAVGIALAVALAGFVLSLRTRQRAALQLLRVRAKEQLRVQQAALNERQRLARDLHDSVSQALFSMTLHARAAEMALDRAGLEADGEVGLPVGELASLSRVALAQTRALIFELRPDALDEEGLAAALLKHSAAIAARTDVPVEIHAPAERLPLDGEQELQVFRIALEAITNALKHANATRVDIHIAALPDGARVTISDDGVGFDPCDSFPGHLGLESMSDRARMIGAHLTVDSAPGRGTTIDLLVDPSAVRAETASGPGVAALHHDRRDDR